MDRKTHDRIDPNLCGTPREIGEGFSSVALETTAEMAVDERGLVHGGFLFGLADHAAMLSVNEPTVVLGQAETRFLKPVVVGEELVADAEIIRRDGIKRIVHVEVRRTADGEGDGLVFSGEFVCYVLDTHVLDR